MAGIYYRRARPRFPPAPRPQPQGRGWGGGRGATACGAALLQQRTDELREAVPGSIEAAFHRAQVAPRDVGDLSVALAFQLAEHEDRPVVGGQLVHALVDGFLEEALAVQVVGPGRGVFELERAVVRLPVLFDRLEQHQRVAATVPELVLGQVRRDGVDPGRELLGLVEAVEMTEHADEDLLHEVLRALPVSNGPIDEVEQAGLVAVYQGAEGWGAARQVLEHQPAVVKLVQRLALERARRRDCLALPREGCSHGPLHVEARALPLIKIRQEPYPSHHLRTPRSDRCFTDAAWSRPDTSVLIGGRRVATS